jgi:hypothetical protein
VGVEHIDMSKPLKIEGRVENYLQVSNAANDCLLELP